jgi:hypothetical protein
LRSRIDRLEVGDERQREGFVAGEQGALLGGTRPLEPIFGRPSLRAHRMDRS